MIIKDFYIVADIPAISKKANALLSALDFGISGAYRKDAVILTANYKEESETIGWERKNYEEPNFENTAKSIKMALKDSGCVNINIWWEDEGKLYFLDNTNAILISN